MYRLNITNKEVPETYYGFIFKTIFPNGKIYVGQTTKKVDKPYFGSGHITLKANSKYGKKNLKREIIKFVDNLKQLNNFERIFVKKFKANEINIGYNIQNGGNSKGKHTDDSKRKMSLAHVGKSFSKETRNKLSIAHLGKKLSKETKKKLSEINKGHLNNLGKHHSEETKKKLSKINRGKIVSLKTRKKLRKLNLGRKHSKESKEKMSKYWKEKRNYGKKS